MKMTHTILAVLQDSIFTSSIYWRLKTSVIQEVYGRLFNSVAIRSRSREVDLYRKLAGVRPGDLVFDVGANDGSKTAVFLKLGARVVALEPDEKNQHILRDRFLRHRIFPKPVRVVGVAVGHTVATATMWIDGPGSAVNTLNPKWAECLKKNRESFHCSHCGLNFEHRKVVQTTTLEKLIAEHGRPAYIKIDVEGFEVSVLRGLRQPVPFVSFEVNLPDFRA